MINQFVEILKYRKSTAFHKFVLLYLEMIHYVVLRFEISIFVHVIGKSFRNETSI